MLGGSFWVAMLRNGLSAFLLMAVFLLLDRPRLPMKKTILYYAVYGTGLNFLYSLWYMVSIRSFVKFSGLSALLLVGIFCFAMSGFICLCTKWRLLFIYWLSALHWELIFPGCGLMGTDGWIC